MPKVVLVTGVSRFLGSRLAAELAADATVTRVIGIDSQQPRRADLARLGRTEFMRADIRNPLLARVLAQARVDTVVHTPLLGRARHAGSQRSHTELGVVGTMQLLGACQKSDSVRQLVIRSTTAVYGCGPGDPAVFTEDMQNCGDPASGYAKEAVEIEGYVRGFQRRRSDIAVTVLRLAGLIGPTVDTPLARYLAMPIVPTSLGFDPRLQMLHEDDAVEIMRRAAVERHPGVFNVAGDGIVCLSQAIRRAGRVRLPVPAPALTLAGAAVRNSGALELSAEEASYLNFGRVVDSARVRDEFGFIPRYSTEQALEAYLAAHPSLARLGIATIWALQAFAERSVAARGRTPTLTAQTQE
ncbi:MAG TPA: NAD-dependent epimerase/dehydratase family protein [Jatrophihabitantaceae bacterium]|jgi:UDP-glucose 4-epimerase